MKIFKLLPAILIGIVCFSCDDGFLDKYPISEIAPENYFKSREDLQLYTNSFYRLLPTASGIYNESVDNIIKSTISDRVKGTRTIPTTGGGWNWDELRNINFFLVNSHQCTDKEALKEYNGLAKFFRAYFYHEKIKQFGDVPWYSEPIKSNDTEMLQKPRDSRELVMDSVLADLNYAIEHLPEATNVERVTKWTALAFKSRICLYEGTFRKYHPEFNLSGSEALLQEAASAANEIIISGMFSIYTSSPESAYRDLFASMDAIEEEVILTRRYSDALQQFHNINFYTLASTQGKSGLEKRQVNSYLMNDGSRFTDIPSYESMEFYEETQNRDPRLYQTIRTPGYTRIGDPEVLLPDMGSTVTGYQLTKFVAGKAYDAYQRSFNDMPIIRLGEVLLNFAEAKAELGTITQADVDNSINKLRARVSMPELNLQESNAFPDPYLGEMYPNISLQNKGLLLEIRRERGVELVMENFRWDDIIRWKAGRLLELPFKGMYFPGLGDYDLDGNGTIDVVIYEGEKPSEKGPQYLKLGTDVVLENGYGQILVNPQIPKQFDENKDYLFPIPIQERLLNPNLTQNPGWDDGI